MELFQRCWGLMVIALLLVAVGATEEKGADKSHIPENGKSTASAPERDNNPAMPYVESSQFRSAFPKTEVASSRLTKTASGKFIGVSGKNFPKDQKDAKLAQLKNAYILLSRKKAFEPDQPGKSVKSPFPASSTNNADKLNEGIVHPQPVGFVPLTEDFPSAFVSLPSNEEYDRNVHFMHSILYGYGSGF